MQIDFSRFTEKARTTISGAYQLTVSCHYAQVEDQVLMVSLIQKGKDMVFFLLQEMGVDKTAFCQAISDSMRSLDHSPNERPEFSDSIKRILLNSLSIASENGSSVVALEHIFWSFVETPGAVRDIMASFGITRARTQEAVVAFRNGNITHEEQHQERERTSLRALSKYAQNMIVLAEEGKIEPAIGPKKYIQICLIAVVFPPITASKKAGAKDLAGFIEAPDILNPVKISIVKVKPIIKPVKFLYLFFSIVDASTTKINMKVIQTSQKKALI